MTVVMPAIFLPYLHMFQYCPISPQAPRGEPRAARGDQFIEQEIKFYPIIISHFDVNN